MEEEMKNKEYWLKRRKNNEAARRSREKRRMNDLLLERRVMQLTEENKHLRTQLLSIKIKYGEIDDMKYQTPIGGSEPSFAFNKSPPEFYQQTAYESAQEHAMPSAPRSPTRQFTSRVFTNVTGDTSATVVVNNTGDLPASDNLIPSFHFDKNLSRIISKPSDLSMKGDGRVTFAPTYPQSLAAQMNGNVSEATSGVHQHQDVQDELSGRKTVPIKSELSLDATHNPPPASKEQELSLHPLWRGPTGSQAQLFPPAMLKLLNTFYGKQISNFVSGSHQISSVEVLLSQLQAHLNKLNGASMQEPNPSEDNSKKTGKAYSPSLNPISVFDQYREQLGLPYDLAAARHRSSDSGFDSNEADAMQTPSPLSPPPSPDESENPDISSILFANAEREEREKSAEEMMNLKEYLGVDGIRYEHSARACDRASHKSARSHSVGAVYGVNGAKKVVATSGNTKSEFKLPFKLRLKKCSLTHDRQMCPSREAVDLSPLGEAGFGNNVSDEAEPSSSEYPGSSAILSNPSYRFSAAELRHISRKCLNKHRRFSVGDRETLYQHSENKIRKLNNSAHANQVCDALPVSVCPASQGKGQSPRSTFSVGRGFQEKGKRAAEPNLPLHMYGACYTQYSDDDGLVREIPQKYHQDFIHGRMAKSPVVAI